MDTVRNLLSCNLSRRELLKLGAAGLACLFLSPLEQVLAQVSDDDPVYGRILEQSVEAYDQPSFQGNLVRVYWQDLVVPITAVTVGDYEPHYNRVWYRLENGGYVHSGVVQPTRILPQEPDPTIPASGRLGEISVPFTDAYWKPDTDAGLAYRLYYETTHWVTRMVTNDAGETWYEILDDKWKYSYYVQTAHVRILPLDQLAPLAPEVPMDAKRIEIHRDKQLVIAYQNEQPVWMTRVATGARFSDGDHTTPEGRYITYHKRPFRHMAAGDLAAPNSYDLPGVPWVSYFTPEGISIHGTYWHNDFGKPRSHGCINCSCQAAHWIYRWTMPMVPPQETEIIEDFGTAIDIY